MFVSYQSYALDCSFVFLDKIIFRFSFPIGVSQGFIPSRKFDLMDPTADALGILSFTYLSYLSRKKSKH